MTCLRQHSTRVDTLTQQTERPKGASQNEPRCLSQNGLVVLLLLLLPLLLLLLPAHTLEGHSNMKHMHTFKAPKAEDIGPLLPKQRAKVADPRPGPT